MSELETAVKQESKLDMNTDNQRQNTHLKRIIGILLSVVMIALTVYVLKLQHQNNNTLFQSTDLALVASNQATVNYRTYVGRYNETKLQLEETTHKLEEVNKQLDQVTTELANTRNMLAQTQGMLDQAQDENVRFKRELQGLDNLRNAESVQNIGELEARIKTLKDRDTQVSNQLAELKSQLRAFDAQFSNPQEGKSLITLFQNKIKLVKNRMHYLKQEAFLARIAAQKEKDRLESLNGNSGFVLRNGKSHTPGTKKSFAIDVKIVQ